LIPKLNHTVPLEEAYWSDLILSFLILPKDGPNRSENSFSGNDLVSCAVIDNDNKKAKMKIIFFIYKMVKGFGKYSFYILLLGYSVSFFSQTPDKIKIKKEDEFFFFQAGKKTDTISPGKGDLFYLKLTGQKRCDYHIEVENGQLLKTGNDSLFRLVKIQNFKYLHYFVDSVMVSKDRFAKQVTEKCFKYKTFVNGAHNADPKNRIYIRIFNVTTGDTLLTNKFYYR
jgi:hypothetical protein